MLIKYKDSFQDFDSVAFVPLLENRIDNIKNNEFEDNFYETGSFTMVKQAEEMMKEIKKNFILKYILLKNKTAITGFIKTVLRDIFRNRLLGHPTQMYDYTGNKTGSISKFEG